MTSRGRRRAVLTLIACMLVGAAAVVGARRYRVDIAAANAPAEVRAPDSVRVRVEVLNATKTRGLARRATMLLRDRGFDVLEVGTVRDARDTTLVIDLTEHPDWAARVAAVMEPARVVSRPDSSRYLDISVLIGSAWRPASLPFHP